MANPELTGITLGANSQQASFTSAEIPNIRAGSLLVINGFTPVEITSVTKDGTKKCNLARPWPYGVVSNGVAYVVPTDSSQYEKLKELVTLINTSNDAHNALLASIATLATSTGDVVVPDAAGVNHTLQGWLSLPAVALTEMQKIGLGKDSLPAEILVTASDWGKPAGSLAFISESSVGIPVSGYFIASWSRRDNGGGYLVTAVDQTTGIKYQLIKLNGGVPSASDWDEVFTGANLNPNVFNANGVSDFIKEGYTASTTVAVFLLPVSFLNQPSSRTITGTFKVTDFTGTPVAGGTGLDATNISMDAGSCSKTAVIVVTGLSGMVADSTVILKSELSTSEIEINK